MQDQIECALCGEPTHWAEAHDPDASDRWLCPDCVWDEIEEAEHGPY